MDYKQDDEEDHVLSHRLEHAQLPAGRALYNKHVLKSAVVEFQLRVCVPKGGEANIQRFLYSLCDDGYAAKRAIVPPPFSLFASHISGEPPSFDSSRLVP